MNETLFTVEEAAEQLKTSINSVFQMAISGKLRMGVNARDWLGMWMPMLAEDEFTLAGNKIPKPIDIDADGYMRYIHTLSDGSEIELKEFIIHHFWYIEQPALYSFLTKSGRPPSEIISYQPTHDWHQQALQIRPARVTKHGFFLASMEMDGVSQDLLIDIDDLLIASSDLPVSENQPDKQTQREDALKRLISEVGLEELVPLGRQGVWNKLREAEKHLFAASSESTIKKFYEKQNIIAFK